MNMEIVFIHILVWGLIGGLLLTVFVLYQHLTGIPRRIYGQQADSVEQLRALGLRLFWVTIALLFAVPLAADLALGFGLPQDPGFGLYWGVGFSVILLMHVWDFLVVDLFILLSLKPRFLALPDVEYYRSAAPHLRAFAKGVFLGAATSMIAAGIAVLAA